MSIKLFTIVFALAFATTIVSAQSITSIPVPPVVPELTVRERVELEFLDAPIMVKIADAESDFIATAKNPNSSASGVFQILRGTWNGNKYNPACSVLGDFDTYKFDVDKNIACARIIYEDSGTSPWNESRGTWNKKVAVKGA